MPRLSLIQIRKGQSSEWSFENPILASGEPGFSIDDNILKIGNGSDAWTLLDPIGSGTSIIPQPYKNYITVTSNYSISGDDDVIFADTASNNITISLPNASGIGGKQISIKKLTGNNSLIVDTSEESQSIDLQQQISIFYNFESINFISNNHNWFIL